MAIKPVNPIRIDGSQGEGGGQILRTSLGLSALTGKPFRIANIRANRDKPGLMRQHLTAVNAAAAVCGAKVDGAAVGARELSFEPGTVKAGDYTFAIGSAGSTTLVLQAILPALLTADAPSRITLEGGTHNPFAPPVDFLEHAFLPIVNRMGPRVDVALERHGFYPAGGGRWCVTVTPAKTLTPVHLDTRGEIHQREARALVAGLSGEIGVRELDRVAKRLGWENDERKIRQLPNDEGPGNAMMLFVHAEHVTEVFTAFGQRRVTAEAVADEAIDACRGYLAGGAPVGEYLADQLLVPLAIAGGGSFVTAHVSKHATTNMDVIRQFLPVRIDMLDAPGQCKRIVVTSAQPGDFPRRQS